MTDDPNIDLYNFAVDFEVEQFEKNNRLCDSEFIREKMVEWLRGPSFHKTKCEFIEWLKTQKKEG